MGMKNFEGSKTRKNLVPMFLVAFQGVAGRS